MQCPRCGGVAQPLMGDGQLCQECFRHDDEKSDRREALLRELRTKIGRIGAAMYVSFNIAVAGACDDLVASIDAELGETPTTGGEVKK